MSRSRKSWVLKSVVIVLLLFGGAVLLLSRIDRAEPLTPEQNALSPGAIEIASAADIDHAPYLDYLKQKAQPPVDYVVETFTAHDVVLLGEVHQIREDCELIAQLVEPVYRRAGVRMLAMELIKQKRTEEINQLLIAPVYDEPRVVRIFQEDYFYWGFQEYLDILRAVWAFNRTLTQDEAPFMLIGIQPDIDVYGADCGGLLGKVKQLPRLLRIEESYAAPVMRALDRHDKVLVQVGYHHTFRHYHTPKVIGGKMYGEFVRTRMGELLADQYGDRVFQISLHVRHNDANRYMEEPATPVSMLLEALYVENGSVPIAFDVQNSPFAGLRDTSGTYFKYQPYVTLGQIAQGYILQYPYRQLHCVNWVQGFANSSNLDELRTYAIQRNMISADEGRSPAKLNECFTALLADGRRFRDL